MSPERTWKLKIEDGTLTEFKDIRRKVGNQIIRAYLLENVLSANRLECVNATLRGPKNEFKDFDDFFVLSASNDENLKILVEANVYQNLRIVGTDSERITNMNTEQIISLFTEMLDDPESHATTLIISENSKVSAKQG
ncbi:MAG: hypothetical protein ACXABV_05465 [Candidatus Thorarchaeota archaeon]